MKNLLPCLKQYCILLTAILVFNFTSSAQYSRTKNSGGSPYYNSSYQRMAAASITFTSFEIREGGTLWGWGKNANGQLGDGTTANKSVPVQIGTDTKWLYVTGGEFHTLAIKADGTLWTWGSNAKGQLGIPSIVGNATTPYQIGTDNKWVSIAAGQSFSMAIQSNGTLWGWGENADGQLGIGTNAQQNSPVQVGTNTDWKTITCGAWHSAALKSNGSLWTCGTNNFGQLGDGTTTARNTLAQIGSPNTYINITAGAQFTAALRVDGTIWSCGRNDEGQLGDNTTIAKSSLVQAGTANTWVHILSGVHHTLALKADGTMWAWGYNNVGQLGDGTVIRKLVPTQIGTDNTWVTFGIGQSSSFGVKSNGSIWAWGNNGEGQLGDGTTTQKTSPIQIIATDKRWITVCQGYFHSSSLKSDGTIWGWGANTSRQLADGVVNDKLIPLQMGYDNKWVNISSGSDYHIAIKSDGTLWGWGAAGVYQLGFYSPSGVVGIPTQIGTDNKWIKIATGGSQSYGIKSDGTLWTWGDNSYGQAGLGSTSVITAPTQIGTDNKWVEISAGAYFAHAIKSDGTLWGWGDKQYGQIGNGTAGGIVTSPVQIGTDTKWVSVSGGYLHTLGLKSDGTLWAWGRGDDYGQIGVGAATNSFAPIQVGSETSWIDMSAVGSASHAVKSNGSMWSWGDDLNYQTSDPSHYRTLSPYLVSGQTNVVRLGKDGGFGNFMDIIKSERNQICTIGQNEDGQLGLGYSGFTDIATYQCNNYVSNKYILPAANTTLTQSVGTNGNRTDFQSNGIVLVSLDPGTTNPVSGNVITKVWVETSQPSLYVKRHYEITPPTNPTTRTGRVTLYFTQAEFDAFNAVNTLKLPADPADATGKANLRVEKKGGSSNNGSGLPETYTGTTVVIDPTDTDITWDAAASYWSVSFNVTGFSGFFIKTTSVILPLTLIDFKATKQADNVLLQWLTHTEQNVNGFRVERKTESGDFESIGFVAAKNTSVNDYTFTDYSPVKGVSYYRLKMVDIDGKFTYSKVIQLSYDANIQIMLYPNPVTDMLYIKLSDAQPAFAIVLNSTGQTVKKEKFTGNAATINLSGVPKGIYTVKINQGDKQSVVKVVKQ
jgi:alpha-tubulin suppressor-like RCC1 family protein